jgi:hypothetical protein
MQVGFPTHTLSSQVTAFANYNVRVVIPSSLLTGSTGKVVVTLKGPTSQATKLSSVYIGHVAASGDIYDFDGNQRQVFFSGAGSITLSVGQLLASDLINFHLDVTKNLIVAFHVFNDLDRDNLAFAATTGITGCYKGPGADESGTTNVTGYTPTSNYHYSVVSILGDELIAPKSFGWIIV